MGIIKQILTVLLGKTEKTESIEKYERELFEKVDVADEGHREYLNLQLKRTLHKKDTNPFSRAGYFVEQLSETIKAEKDARILCVGCRDLRELNEFRNAEFHNVTGIDLHSEDPSILIMDMHNMEFEDNTFDVLLSSHSLEHSCDAKKAIKEFIRVSKESAVIMIEVPVNFEPKGADIVDFGSLEGLYKLFRKHAEINKIYLEDYLKCKEGNNLSGGDVIRTIFEIEKA